MIVAFADAVRLTLAGAGLLLAITCCGGAVVAPDWNQRARFLVTVGYSTIIVGGQLDTLGHPPTWRTWALVAVTALALASTGAFLVQHIRHARREGRE